MKLTHVRRFLGLGSLAIVTFAVPAAFLACTTEVASTQTPAAATTSPASSTSPEPSASSSSTEQPATKDAGKPSAPAQVKLAVGAASYRNTTAAGGGFVYAIEFEIENDSSEDVTSLDAMTFDLGDGNQVALTKPACSGSFPIEAGASRLVETQVVVSGSGSLTNFSFICPGKQTFGGASGKAPGTAAFEDPIAVTVSGKTSNGTFSATGSATRSN